MKEYEIKELFFRDFHSLLKNISFGNQVELALSNPGSVS